jgi:hypothetical protein
LFTGLVIDLLASGDRRRLGRALEVGLTRLERVVELAPGRHLAAGASSSARTG